MAGARRRPSSDQWRVRMYLVTGGAGFIGSNLVAALRDRGDAVAVCDWLDDANRANLARHLDGRDGLEVVPPEALDDWLAAPGRALDAIFHMGAISATTERDVDRVMRHNYLLSARLWDWCTRAGVPLIYASSAATYGDGSQGFDDDNSPAALARLRPLNPYGWSKLMFDRAATARDAAGRRPPQWAGLRFFNVYGPNEYHKGSMRSVVPQFWQQVRETGRARLFRSHDPAYADGGQMRDFVHVADTVAVMLWLAATPGVSGIFNLGTGTARSFDDMARAVFAAEGLDPAIDYIDMPDSVRRQYQYFTQARMDRLRAAGYDRPFISLEDGVASYVRDYLATNDPYV